MATHPPTVEHVQQRDGELYIGHSRVTLSSAISAWKQGNRRPESIVSAYPTLSLAAAYGAVTYYLDHQEELEQYFAQGRREFERLRAESQAADPAFHTGMRRRMDTLRDSGFLRHAPGTGTAERGEGNEANQ